MVKRVGHPEANPKIKVPAIKAGASRNREALRGRLHDEHLASTHTHIILIRSLYPMDEGGPRWIVCVSMRPV